MCVDVGAPGCCPPGYDVEVASRLNASLRKEDVAVIQWWAERETERAI
jgi:hypothetical protein